MDNENKNPAFKIEIPECLEEPVKSLAAPVSHEIGQTLGDVWFLIFGKLGLYAGKKRAEYEQALAEYKASLERKIESVPPEKRVLPDTQVVAGALEDSRFCVEKKELREMFENLIAASVNSDTADSVHPAFSDIIRHMSPHDAKILERFNEHPSYPVVNFNCYLKNGESFPFYQNIICADDDLSVLEEDSLSLECLKSLGLISITYDSHLTNLRHYWHLTNEHFFKMLQTSAAISLGNPPDIETWGFQKGIALLTDFGIRFLNICT